MLELVDRTSLSFVEINHKRSSRFSDKRGYSLIGKTASLQFVILGSSPNISSLSGKINKL